MATRLPLYEMVKNIIIHHSCGIKSARQIVKMHANPLVKQLKILWSAIRFESNQQDKLTELKNDL